MIDLALLIDEANLRVRGVGINPHFDEVLSLAERGQQGHAVAVLQAGRMEVANWLVENASDVRLPSALFGRPAAVLYQALAGRCYGGRPSEYQRWQLRAIAVQARAFIASRRRRKAEPWLLAWRVVEAAGPVIQPWLCTLVVDSAGRPAESSPLYDVRIWL